jgi:hypothetical protein
LIANFTVLKDNVVEVENVTFLDYIINLLLNCLILVTGLQQHRKRKSSKYSPGTYTATLTVRNALPVNREQNITVVTVKKEACSIMGRCAKLDLCYQNKTFSKRIMLHAL